MFGCFCCSANPALGCPWQTIPAATTISLYSRTWFSPSSGCSCALAFLVKLSPFGFSAFFFGRILIFFYPYGKILIERSLEVKLPTIWTDEKQSRAEA